MSTHLHLDNQLPNLPITAANSDNNEYTISSSESNQTPTHHHSNMSSSSSEITIAETEINQNDIVANDVAVAAVVVDDVAVPAIIADSENDESYKTPTSKESKIPEILTCPPAPKKPKPFVSCKRKLLDEFQFFEVTNEDMDAFFRSTFPKRTCPCTWISQFNHRDREN